MRPCLMMFWLYSAYSPVGLVLSALSGAILLFMSSSNLPFRRNCEVCSSDKFDNFFSLKLISVGL